MDRDSSQRGGHDAARASHAPLRVAVFPQPRHFNNPYLTLLHAALEKHGVRVEPPRGLTARWASRAHHTVDAVHLHWVEQLLLASPRRFRGAVSAYLKGARLLVALWLLRRSRVRIVWTVHNLRPHESRFPRLEAAVGRGVLRLADHVIVHSSYAAGRVLEELGSAARIAVVPHGPYVDAYPSEDRSRAEVRAELELPPDAFVYLMFGNVRRYKRIPDAIEAFRSLPDGHIRLLIVGQAHPEEAPRVISAAARDPRIRVELRNIPDEEVATYHVAADVVVLNHAEVFSSGALLLALSLGVGVIAPGRSTATEVAEPPAVESFEPGGLATAMAAARGTDAAVRREAARAAACAHTWDWVAERTSALYRG